MINEKMVSVIMSIYNTPIKYLKESIDSILGQTYKNLEFIIIDDGMSKEEIEFVKSYDDNRIRFYHNEKNIGLEKSLNKGIKLANSDYVIRMDADDIAYLDRIEKQMDFILKNPEYSIIGTCARFFDEGTNLTTDSKAKGIIEKKDFLKGPPLIHPTLVIKKDALEKIGGYPLYRRCEDYAMEMELYCNGYKGYEMNEILLMVRRDNIYNKRTLKSAITSCKLRWKYFRKMKIKWYQYIWVLKPLATGKIFYFLKKHIKKDCR